MCKNAFSSGTHRTETDCDPLDDEEKLYFILEKHMKFTYIQLYNTDFHRRNYGKPNNHFG